MQHLPVLLATIRVKLWWLRQKVLEADTFYSNYGQLLIIEDVRGLIPIYVQDANLPPEVATGRLCRRHL